MQVNDSQQLKLWLRKYGRGKRDELLARKIGTGLLVVERPREGWRSGMGRCPKLPGVRQHEGNEKW